MLESLGEKKKAEPSTTFSPCAPPPSLWPGTSSLRLHDRRRRRYDIPLPPGIPPPTWWRIWSPCSTWAGPRITRHGVLIEVYGEGILLVGDGGVGKAKPPSSSLSAATASSPTTPWKSVGCQQVAGGPRPGEYPPLHRAARRGHHQRPGASSAWAPLKMSENRHVHQHGDLGRHQLYDRMGIDSEYTENPGHPGAGDDHPRKARP